MFPAIWKNPNIWEYGCRPKCGVIDIMENVGNWPDSVLGSVHTGVYNGMIGTQKTNGIKLTDLSTAFYLYSIMWTINLISFLIDNIKYYEFTNENKESKTWPFNKEFHLLLNIAAGGNWVGKFGVNDKIFPQKCKLTI